MGVSVRDVKEFCLVNPVFEEECSRLLDAKCMVRLREKTNIQDYVETIKVRGHCLSKQKLELSDYDVRDDVLLAYLEFAKAFGSQVKEFYFSLECTKNHIIHDILMNMTCLETLKILEEQYWFPATEIRPAVFRDPLASVKKFKICGVHDDNNLTEEVALAMLNLCPNTEELAVGKPARVFCELIAKGKERLTRLKTLDVGLIRESPIGLVGLVQLDIPLRTLHVYVEPSVDTSGIILGQLLKKFCNTLAQVEIFAIDATEGFTTLEVAVPCMKMLKKLRVEYSVMSLDPWLPGVELVAAGGSLPENLPKLRQLGVTSCIHPHSTNSAREMFEWFRPIYEDLFRQDEKWNSVKLLDILYPFCHYDNPKSHKDMRASNLGEYAEFYNGIFNCFPFAKVEEFELYM